MQNSFVQFKLLVVADGPPDYDDDGARSAAEPDLITHIGNT